MELMTLLVSAAAVAVLGYAARHFLTPTCPSCRGRAWDRKLCRPMLLCRRCATRILPPQRLFG
jgi:hypothetical protein